MGNEHGRLTAKHLDKNHVFEHNNSEFRPKPPISFSNYSVTTSQKSSASHLPKLSKPDLSQIFELANTMAFVQNFIDFNFAYKTNVCLSQNNALICNEEDLESPKNVFTRETFGGIRGKRVWDKKLVMKVETMYLMEIKSENIKKMVGNEKNLFIDLNLSKLSHNIKSGPVQPLASVKETKESILQVPLKEPSLHSNQSEDRKSPQFQTKSTEDFQTANFTGLQSYLLSKTKEPQNPLKIRENSQSLMKSSSENRIPTPKPRKNSKTESEFSDFSNHSYTDIPPVQKEKAKNHQTKSPSKSPLKSAQLMKNNEKDAFNFKKEKPMVFSNKNIEENNQNNYKKSLTPNMKPPKVEDNKKIKGVVNMNHQMTNNTSKIIKKNSQTMNVPGNNTNSNNGSSEEEPLHIKISLDLKKFNKNLNKSNNNQKVEENNEEKDFENNQFLKSVVKDIDKLTQKMLNTNNNLSGLNTSQASDNNRKIPRKSGNDMIFSSNQQSETSESDYGKVKPIVPTMRKK